VGGNDIKKGQNKRIWTKEQKLEIINKHLEEHISVRQLEKIHNADRSMICHWLKAYSNYGEDAFNLKSRITNVFASLHTSNNLSENERLKLTIAKLEIENERLKKGYIARGVGVNKEYVTLKDMNMKSSTHSKKNME